MSNNKTLRTFKIIGPELTWFIEDIEKTFSVKVDAAVLQQIMADAENGSMAAKDYKLFEASKNLCKTDLVITGRVEAYEPEVIWIQVTGISERDMEYLK